MHIVILVAKAAQRPSHRNHIVVGMRTEDDDLLRIRRRAFGTCRIVGIRFATGPAGNGMLDIVEDFDVYLISRTIERKQLAQVMFAIVFVCQLQDRFAGQLAEPYDSAADKFLVPYAARNQPRMADARQAISSREVHHYLRVRMCLEIGRRHGISYRPFDGLRDDVCLVVAPSQEDYVLRFHHVRDAHRDDARRNGFYRRETPSCLLACRVFQEDEAGARTGDSSRTVEHHVACLSDTEQHIVDTAQLVHQLFIFVAECEDIFLRHRRVGRIDVFRTDIDVVQKVFLHVFEDAGDILRQRIELIFKEYNHIAEAQPLFLVHPD